MKNLKEKQEVKLEKINPKQSFTEPPPRYTEASLVKALDEKDKRIFFLENEARKIIEQDLDKAKVDLYENYISKEVIREKIKEIEDSLKEDCIALHEFQRLAKIDILKEILGE